MTNEKGITLVSLVIMIIIILILASIGTKITYNNIELSKFEIFKTELKLMQTKVNELTEKKENNNIGEIPSASQLETLNAFEVNEQLEKFNKNKEEMKKGFKVYTKNFINEKLGLKNITRDFLVNVENCIVIAIEPFKYEKIDYYMSEQIENLIYNVKYKNQINQGKFDYNINVTNNHIKITPLNTQYVSKFQVKYRLKGIKQWNIVNKLEFNVDTSGVYEIEVKHENDETLKLENGKLKEFVVNIK